MYLGDFRLAKTFDVKFTTIDSTGLPVTLAGSPVVSAYPDNSTTQLTAGITLTVDFDSVTGLHNIRVVATGANGYATATNYTLVLTAGTVSGISVVGYCVAHFSIEARSALMPATADRTAVVDAAGLLDANMVKAGPTGSGTAQTARDLGASVLLSPGTGTGQLDITSGVVKANLVQILAAAITGTAAQLVAAFTKFFNVATPTGTINSLPDAVPDAAGGLPITGTRLTAVPWNAAWDAEVQSEAQDAITASALATAAELAKVPKSDAAVTWNATALASMQAEAQDAITASALATAANLATVDTVVDAILADTGTDGVVVAAASKTGYALSAAGVQAIWDALVSALTTVGSIGKRLVDYLTGDIYARIGAPVGASISADIAALPTDADVNAQVDTALADYDPPTKAELDTAVANVSVDEIQATALADLFNTNSGTTYASAVAGSPVKEIADNAGGSALTVAGIADGVWDEAISGHLGAGSTGNALNAAGSAGDPWSTAIPGAYGAGTAGKILGDNINAPIATVDTVVDGIAAKTVNLPSDPADQSAVEAAITAATGPLATAAALATVAGYLDTEIGAILTETQSHPTLAEIEATTVLAKQAKLDTLHDTRIPGVVQPQTGDSFARLGAPAGLSVSADMAAVKGDTAAVLTDTGTDGVVVATASKTGYALSAAGVDSVLDEVVEGTTTVRQGLKGIMSALFAKLSGAATTTITVRDIGDTKARITATVDENGNRTAVTTDLT